MLSQDLTGIAAAFRTFSRTGRGISTPEAWEQMALLLEDAADTARRLERMVVPIPARIVPGGNVVRLPIREDAR